MKQPSLSKGIALPTGYAPLLADLKTRVRAAQVRATLSVNRELVLLYWHIGREILRCQTEQGWGAKIVERLANDLRAEFPEMRGFSSRNLNSMLAFAGAWASVAILSQLVIRLAKIKGQQAAAQIVQRPVSEFVPQPVTQLGAAIGQHAAAKFCRLPCG